MPQFFTVNTNNKLSHKTKTIKAKINAYIACLLSFISVIFYLRMPLLTQFPIEGSLLTVSFI